MFKTPMAACLAATALMAAPALAQTSAPAANPPAATTMPGAKVTAGEFVNQAANSDMFEIQSSQLALTKAQDNSVRDFAQQMVKDHTAASEKLKAAAKDQTVPANLDQEHAQMLQRLQQASGHDFDRSYVQMQFDGHQKAVTLFESYAQSGDDTQLKQFAQQTVPTLREHLQKITQIRNSLSAPAPTVSQSQSSGSTASAQSANTGNWLKQEQPGQWRTSKLDGLNVYNENNDKIGDIKDLLVDNSGKVQAVVIGVGGFLGMGEHDIAVPMDQLSFVNEPRSNVSAANTGTAGSTGTAATNPNAPATTGTVTTTRSDTANRSAPDHAVLKVNMTKDQLKAAPEFKYSR